MKVNVQAHGITLTPDIYEYLDKKLAHIEKLLGPDSSAIAHVEVGKTTNHHKTGNLFEAKIQLRIAGREFTGHASGESVYAAIDILKDEISAELSNHKDKKLTRIKNGGRAVKNLMRRMWPFGQSAS